MLDVVIKGGDLIDGTGSPRRRADVGIVDGKIVRIGTIEDEAADTIDATGKVVTPGFVDVHTHYDAQVFWDGALTPSPLHGVTTARRELRLHDRAAVRQPRRRRLPHADAGAGGGHAARVAALECRGTGPPPRSTSTRSTVDSGSTRRSWSVTRPFVVS